jgi:ribosome biogenesis GTPase
MVTGLVIRSQSGFYTVSTDAGCLTCHLRGRLKQGPRKGDVVAVGDRVRVSLSGAGHGMIEAIEPRARMFSRMSPQPQGEYQQVLIANPDQVVLVFACLDPAPRLAMLDRFLVIAEKAGIPPVIVANKSDLVEPGEAQTIFQDYEQLGYRIIFTSVVLGDGIGELSGALLNMISLFTGPSGVGKSSLLNAIQPGLGLAAREVSHATSKGRHTTVVRELFELQEGGWVADTPGLKALALWDIEPEELDGYFPEMRLLVQNCQFNNCTHQHEPGCAVIEAVWQGRLSAARYDSYLRMRFGN